MQNKCASNMNYLALNFVTAIINIAIGIGALASGNLFGFVPLLGSSYSWYVVGNALLPKSIIEENKKYE